MPDVHMLSAESAKNVADQDQENITWLPYCVLMDAGVPCTSRTPLSSKNAANVHCSVCLERSLAAL